MGIPPAQAPGLIQLARSYRPDPRTGWLSTSDPRLWIPGAWDGPIRQSAQIMTALAADGIRLVMLDVGGGFPVRYDTDPPPLADYAAVIRGAAARLPYPVQPGLRTRAGDRRPGRHYDRLGDRRRMAAAARCGSAWTRARSTA